MLILDSLSLKYALNYCTKYPKQQVGIFVDSSGYAYISKEIDSLMGKKGFKNHKVFENDSSIHVFDANSDTSYRGFIFAFSLVDPKIINRKDIIENIILMENNYKSFKKPLTLKNILELSKNLNIKDLELELVDKNGDSIYEISPIIKNTESKTKAVFQLK